MIDLKEAHKRRLEEARKVLGFSQSYLTLQKYPLKEEENDLALRYLDRIVYLNPEKKVNPIITFEDNSHVLFFPFYVYDDKIFEEKKDTDISFKGPGYFFVGSIKYPTQLERIFFKIAPDGREQLFSMMKEFYSYKKQLIREGKITLGNFVTVELSKGIEDSKRQINEILYFRENSKKARGKYYTMGYSGNRMHQTKKRNEHWTQRQVSNEAYYKKQMDHFLEWFYTERISFSQSIIDSTKEKRKKIQEQINKNPLLFDRISRVMRDSYLRIVQREGKVMGNDHLIITEAIFYALMNQDETQGKVNIVSSDHHFREIPDYIKDNKFHFYNSKMRNFLEGKKLNLVIYKNSPVLALNKTPEDIQNESLAVPSVRIILKHEGKNRILERMVL